MRISIITGLFCILVAGTTMAARADETAPASGVVATAAAESPDVAAWTSNVAALPAVSEASAPAKSSKVNSFASRILSRTSSIAQGLTHQALRFLGTPYVFGGTSTGGFDCSGYVQHVFAMIGIRLPRTADAQFYGGSRIAGQMMPGDLVFFQTYEPGPSHVGIYLGNGQFAHASSSHGVMVSKLSDSYWAARYIGAKRVVGSR